MKYMRRTAGYTWDRLQNKSIIIFVLANVLVTSDRSFEYIYHFVELYSGKQKQTSNFRRLRKIAKSDY